MLKIFTLPQLLVLLTKIRYAPGIIWSGNPSLIQTSASSHWIAVFFTFPSRILSLNLLFWIFCPTVPTRHTHRNILNTTLRVFKIHRYIQTQTKKEKTQKHLNHNYDYKYSLSKTVLIFILKHPWHLAHIYSVEVGKGEGGEGCPRLEAI